MSESSFDWGEPIYSYSRAQAIEDGELIDVTPTAREAGIKLPTVVTRAVWLGWVDVPESLKGTQDERGRLWDVVYLASLKMREVARSEVKTDRCRFEVVVRCANGRTQVARLYLTVGPGDTPEPVVTIMEEGED